MKSFLRGIRTGLGLVVSFVGTTLVLLLAGFAGERAYAQLQQSGGPGSTVSLGSPLPAGTNVIGKVGIDQTTPGTSNLVQIGGTLPGFASTPTFNVGTMAALVAGTATIGVVIPKTPCGTTVVNQDVIAVPTVAAAVFTSTTCLMKAFFNNTNLTAQTVTLTDNAGTPLNGVGPAFSVPGLSNMFLPFDGIRVNAGVRWVAGGAGITGGMWGYQ